MDEHEVPTHVQAEDRVLLWFTFPQIVALTAVAALSYGVYQVAPFGPEAVRVGAGLVFALVGVALVVGKVGGRRLPAVAADLLRFGFGARRFQGPPAQLVRAQPPVPSERAAKREATGRPCRFRRNHRRQPRRTRRSRGSTGRRVRRGAGRASWPTSSLRPNRANG